MTELSYEKAFEYAEKKHSGQYRIGGDKYITHPVAVAETVKSWGYGTEYQIAALFHDLLEDTDALEEELLSLSNERVLAAVRLLTKDEHCCTADYVAGIKKNKMAFIVKTADRLHNLKSAFCTSDEFKRRYLLETIKYYIDFSPEIKDAAVKLAASMDKPVKVDWQQ